MPLTVSPVYAGLLGLLFVFLSVRVIGARRRSGVALGDGGDQALLRRQRVHGNFAEYVPLGLVLLVCAEATGVAHWQLHLIGSLLLAGRAIHAIGVSGEPEILPLRVAGMALTFTALITAALACLGAGSMLARMAGV